MRNLLLCVALAASTVAAVAQNRFPDAIERSRDAGRIVELLAVLPDSDLPKELVEKAKAVGVFPTVKREAALFMSATNGYGVISARGAGGWTMPAFYYFGGSGYGRPFTGSDSYGIVLLFMTDEALDAFAKGGVKLKGERKALAGPVGAITEEQRKEIEGAHILAYAYNNGRLKGTALGKSFWKKFMLNPDNKINKPLYGMKGREVLAGKEVKTTNIPDGIPAYQRALEKYYAAPR